jgi:hypothetical protein
VADKLAVEFKASGAVSVNGDSGSKDIGSLRTCLKLLLDVTAITAATLKVEIETSPTGTGNWTLVGSFFQNTTSAVGYWRLTVAGCRQFVRARWTVTGTSVTFAVTGEAHVIYAEPADLSKTSINAQALTGITEAVKAECCLRATTDAETSFNSAHLLPLTSWDDDVRGRVADRAVYYCMSSRGFNPASEADQLILLNGGLITTDGQPTAVERWMQSIARGALKPVGLKDQTPEVTESAGFVISDVARSW